MEQNGPISVQGKDCPSDIPAHLKFIMGLLVVQYDKALHRSYL